MNKLVMMVVTIDVLVYIQSDPHTRRNFPKTDLYSDLGIGGMVLIGLMDSRRQCS